ncbi:MAG TPA: nucleotide exchange factor GrpE [Dongiaceae bacterium]|nr:nucleotide exchange factor GrpE [Dongiaceae bacterium]
MSLRPARKPTPQPEPEPGDDGVSPSGDDEIEILEVTGVNETERPLDVVPPIEIAPPIEPDPAAAAEHAALEEALAAARRERDQKQDQALRAQADLDNMRKRLERETVERRLTDAANLFRRLLPVLDNLERALGAAGDRDDPLWSGVVLIHQQLVEAMGKEGLQPIETVGAVFDPARHEAVDMVVAPGRPAGTILEEMQKGYTLRDRLVRPALVRVVAAAPPGNASQGATGT